MKTTIFFIIIGAILFTGCFKNDEKETSKKEQQIIRPVIVIKAIKKTAISSRSFNGIAKSNQEIKLSFKVKGSIEIFDLELGDAVQKNDLIAKLDDTPYKIQVQQALYTLKEAKANLINATSSYQRVKKLYIDQNVSQSELDNAKAFYNSMKAKVSRAKEQLEFAKLQLSYTSLKAPQDGFVASVFMEKGENTNAGTPLILLSDKDIVEVTTQIPENFINYINKDDKVTLVFDSIENESFKAKVSEVAKISNNGSKTFEVVVTLNKKDKRIKSGMASTISFYLDNKQNNILLIPNSSVLNDNSGYFVYVAVPSKENLAVIKRKNIKVGQLTNNGYEIYEGLSLDDLVLKAGMSQVFENMIVKLR